MPNVIVVGAGMGGLAAAIELRARGFDVLVVERADAPGGKAASVHVGGVSVDSGPTVLTMRWVFDEILARANRSLDDLVALEQARVIARHAWCDGSRLDLRASIDESEREIVAFAGRAEGARFRTFMARARATYEASRDVFMIAQRPTLRALMRAKPLDLRMLVALDPFRSMWTALAKTFRDERLRQLFARYATYCGASPFEAPATLNLVAHVEACGVWRVRGGISSLARALEKVARDMGVAFRYGAEVAEVVGRERALGVRLANGEHERADAVLLNADVAAVAGRAFGERAARAVHARSEPSLSAITWAVVGRARGLPLAHHTVLFSDDYRAEFDDLARRRAPRAPTIYVCAQDRGDDVVELDDERFLIVMNAPATGDVPARWSNDERVRCERAAFLTMKRCGLTIAPRSSAMTTPVEIARRFPMTRGALYGPRQRSALSPLRRHGAKTSFPGLYLAGGSVHPGPGVPMAALSGRLAATQIAADLRSIAPSSTADIVGTTSMA